MFSIRPNYQEPQSSWLDVVASQVIRAVAKKHSEVSGKGWLDDGKSQQIARDVTLSEKKGHLKEAAHVVDLDDPFPGWG
jgi:hypothetical protein